MIVNKIRILHAKINNRNRLRRGTSMKKDQVIKVGSKGEELRASQSDAQDMQ